MKLGVRLKLFLASLVLVTISVILLDVFLTRRLVPAAVERTREDLFVRVELLAPEVSAAPFSFDDLAGWDSLADALGRYARARVTIIRRDGTVIGDSDVDSPALPKVENHGHRPEVMEALARGRGSSSRWSGTVHEQMMYVAVPFSRGGPPAGVVRAAVPLTDVARTAAQIRGMVLASSFLAILVATVMSSLAVGWVSRSLRSLTSAAKRMAAGELSVKSEVGGSDEVAELGRALNQLGESLSLTLNRLRGERDLQERILVNMREGVLLLGGDGRVVLTNPALKEMLLLGPDVIGRSTLEVIRHAELHDLFQHVRDAGEAQAAEIELGGLKPRRLLVHAAGLPGEDGGLLGVFVDVTELRHLETVRKDFVANVSHELRTPIAAVASAAETLRGAMVRDPKAAASFLDIIERNAARMKDLVDDLLDLSRIEARELNLLIEPVDVAAALQHVLAGLQSRAETKGVRLVVDVPAGLPNVAADRRALDQVLANLVDNAVKYSGDGATVRVRAAATGESIRIAVEDTGPGIEPRHLPRLFERFYRVDNGRSRELGGTGLGLAIVKHLVVAMSGVVAVESLPGQGSTFTVTLPRA